MKLINQTNQKTISSSLKIAKSLLESTLGLLNQEKGVAMLFITRFGIHTFLMKYPIDILILDDKYKIMQIKRLLKPNRLFFWNPNYTKIIELPSQKNLPVKIGDILKIKYN